MWSWLIPPSSPVWSQLRSVKVMQAASTAPRSWLSAFAASKTSESTISRRSWQRSARLAADRHNSQHTMVGWSVNVRLLPCDVRSAAVRSDGSAGTSTLERRKEHSTELVESVAQIIGLLSQNRALLSTGIACSFCFGWPSKKHSQGASAKPDWFQCARTGRGVIKI
jgi:hypothetical protein